MLDKFETLLVECTIKYGISSRFNFLLENYKTYLRDELKFLKQLVIYEILRQCWCAWAVVFKFKPGLCGVVCAGVRQLLAITIQPILMFARLNAPLSLYLYRTSHKHDGLVFPVSACL